MTTARVTARTTGRRMQTVDDFYRLQNEIFWQLRAWHDASFAAEGPVYAQDMAADELTRFVAVVAGLESAVEVMNVLLRGVDIDEPRVPLAIRAFCEHADSGRSDIARRIASDLAVHLSVRAARMYAASDGDRLNLAVTISTAGPDRWLDDVGPYDVFISYRHRRWRDAARRLADELRARGVSCWLDADHEDVLDAVDDYSGTVKRWLRDALGRSQCVVVFAATLEAIVDTDRRGRQVAFNWQAFELEHARALLAVHPDDDSSGVLYTDESYRRAERYTSIGELAEHISDQVKAGIPPRPTPADPPLGEELRKLVELGVAYGVPAATMTPLAQLAMLAPRGVQQGSGPSGPFRDDILLALLRSAPRLSAAFRGVDVTELFEAAARGAHGRWSAPDRFRWLDAFGSRTGDAGERLAAAGAITESVMLRAIVAGMRRDDPRSFVRQALLNRVEGTPDDAVLDAKTDDVLRAVSDLPDDGCGHGLHAWLLMPAAEGTTTRLLSRWGRYDVDVDGLATRVSVYVSVPPELVGPDVDLSFGAALGGDLSALEAVFEAHPEIACTLTGEVLAATVWLTRTSDGDLVVLAAENAEPVCARSPGGPIDAQTLSRAPVAAPLGPPGPEPTATTQVLGLDGPFAAHIVGDPCGRVDARPHPLDAFDLALTVLGPTHAYSVARRASYAQ